MGLTQVSINIPFERNPYFTGRDAVLAQLHETFTSKRKGVANLPLVISGLGGIGKTQLAIEYAYRFQEEYQYIFWLRAEELLASDFAAIATTLDLPIKHDENQNIAVATVKRWLQTHENWLLVLDNVVDVENARGFLPSGMQGHVLFTARTSLVGNALLRIEPGTMKPEDAILFLLRRTKRYPIDTFLDTIPETEQQHAKALAERMGYLPLALDQAAAYIERTNCGLVGYVSRYEQRRTRLLSERGNSGVDHPEPVATTWSLSFEEVEHKNAASTDLLRLCAFLDPDAIPEEMLTAGASELTPSLQTVVTDIFELDDSIITLYEYSLVRRNHDEKTLTIHRLVQTVLKDNMDADIQRQWAERTVRMVNQALPDLSFKAHTLYQQYLPHVQVCATLIQQWSMTFPEALRLLLQTGKYLHEHGQYRDAEKLLQQLLAIQEQTLGEHLDVAFTLNELGELARLQGKYNQSIPLHQRALTIRERLLGQDHPDVATSLNNLARPYHHFARYSEAETLYQRALKIREQVLEPEHPDVAHSLNDLAVLYDAQGRYKEAEQLYQRALKIREQALGPEHPDTSETLGNLAGLYSMQGRDIYAHKLLQDALAIRIKVLGSKHPDTAHSLASLATYYASKNNFKEAEPLFQRALKILEEALGLEHPEVAKVLMNYSTMLMNAKRKDKAKEMEVRAKAIQAKYKQEDAFTIEEEENDKISGEV